jgi:hypothetical protein
MAKGLRRGKRRPRLPNDVAAGKHAAKLIEEKLGKGYVEVK